MTENIKYINADEFVTKLDTMKNPNSEFATDDYIDGFSDGISAVIKELEIMPATDVVKVVRCKDCKYLEITGCYGECSRGYLGIVRPDCYCCYGKRREYGNG